MFSWKSRSRTVAATSNAADTTRKATIRVLIPVYRLAERGEDDASASAFPITLSREA